MVSMPDDKRREIRAMLLNGNTYDEIVRKLKVGRPSITKEKNRILDLDDSGTDTRTGGTIKTVTANKTMKPGKTDGDPDAVDRLLLKEEASKMLYQRMKSGDISTKELAAILSATSSKAEYAASDMYSSVIDMAGQARIMLIAEARKGKGDTPDISEPLDRF